MDRDDRRYIDNCVVVSSLEDLDNVDNMVGNNPYEIVYSSSANQNSKNVPYRCGIGVHTWQWYEGFIERYWFCKECDEKDFKREPPIRK